MVNTFPIMLLVGTVLGFLSGLGVGGGSLLILWLTLIAGTEHSVARNINLLFFIPGALIASLFRWKQGKLRIKKIIPAIILGCISAGIFSLIGKNMEIANLKKIFGLILLVTGLRELFYRPRKAK